MSTRAFMLPVAVPPGPMGDGIIVSVPCHSPASTYNFW